MLEVRNLNASYGAVQVLHDVNLTVGAGEIVGLVGANAAGKSTLMFTLAGLRTTYQGEVLLEGVAMEGLPAFERPARGLVLVPERRRLFPFMTVLENLEIGAYAAEARAMARQTLDEVFALLPVLAERRKQVAGSMSGGEQQMLAIGRALMAKPRVLLPDGRARTDLREIVVRPHHRPARQGPDGDDCRAERAPRAAHRRPRLRVGEWPDRHGRQGQRAAQ